MKVLALNCGSSSLKFRLVGVPQEGGDQAVLSMVIGGEVKSIGGRSSLRLTIGDAAPQQTKGAVMHHQQAVQWAFEQLAGQTIDAVGHRRGSYQLRDRPHAGQSQDIRPPGRDQRLLAVPPGSGFR